MDVGDVMVDAFGRVREVVHVVLDGLSPQVLTFRPDPEANSIAWLVWHLTRVEDDHVSAVEGSEQAWLSQGWADRFGLPLDRSDIGYGHDHTQVALVRAEADLLRGYHDAVQARTVEYLKTLRPSDLDRLVDERWDPPVTLGVRLVSVIADALQHAGQAAYIRGMAQRLRQG